MIKIINIIYYHQKVKPLTITMKVKSRKMHLNQISICVNSGL